MEVLFLYYISAMTALVIHELGHLFAVWYVRYKFVCFSLGPLSFVSSDNGLALKFRKSLFTGSVSFLRNPETATIRNEVIVYMAGIASNIVIGCLLVYLYFVMAKHQEISLLLIFGVVSIFIGLANLIPRHYKSLGLDSDALYLLKLYRHTRSQGKGEA